MEGEHQFESTYVGHFIGDGKSFNLRRTSSVSQRSPGPTKIAPQTITDIEAVSIIRRAADDLEPVVDEVRDNEAMFNGQTPTQPVEVPTITARSSISSPPRRAQRLPIWARGTVAQPVRLGPSQIQRASTSPSHPSSRANSSSGIHNRSRSLSSSLTPISLQDWSTQAPPLPSNTSRLSAVGNRNGQSQNQERGRQAGNESQRQRQLQLQLMASTEITTRGGISGTSSLVRSSGSLLSPLPSSSQRSSSSPQTLSVPNTIVAQPNTFQGRISSRRSQAPLTATTNREIQRDRSTTVARSLELRPAASQPQLRRLSNKKRESSLPTLNRPSSARQDRSGGEQEGECCVCLNATCDCVFYRCGHICACLKCARNCKKCPICRETISDIIKIWKS